MRKIITCIGFLFAVTLGKAAEVVITDADLLGGVMYNWTKSNTYLVDGLVYLESGGVLNVEAGTVIKFLAASGPSETSALVICRGAKIYALGTAEEPIIFTAEADDVHDPYDLGPTDNSLWGGLIILGKATTEKNGEFEVSVEGIPSTEPRGRYGAPGNNPAEFDDNDNSGELRYVSIRHTGYGLTSGSELQGLTLGGVGRGTKLSFIDIYASSDDGVEIFGGTVNLKYISVAFAEDDSYDFDEVWKGKAQFLFSIQRSDVADTGWEFDGSTPDDTPAHTQGEVYNFTHIGSGIGSTASNPVALLIRAGGTVRAHNGIVAGMKGKGIEIQDKKNNHTTDSYSRFLEGKTRVSGNIFWNIGSYSLANGGPSGVIRFTAGADDSLATAFSTHFATHNQIEDPGFVFISREEQNELLDPRPSMNGPAYNTLAAYPSDDFFTPVVFKGAISAEQNNCFIAGWTTLARNKHLAPGLSWSGDYVGIENFPIASLPVIYPNPAFGMIYLLNESKEKGTLQIFSVEGKLVMNVLIPGGNPMNAIDISGLNAGVYLWRSQTVKQSSQGRLIIQ